MKYDVVAFSDLCQFAEKPCAALLKVKNRLFRYSDVLFLMLCAI